MSESTYVPTSEEATTGYKSVARWAGAVLHPRQVKGGLWPANEENEEKNTRNGEIRASLCEWLMS